MLPLSYVLLDFVMLIDYLLLSLDIFEHVLGLGQHDIVWEYLRILFIKIVKLRQPCLGLTELIRSLQELIDIIKDQIIFED